MQRVIRINVRRRARAAKLSKKAEYKQEWKGWRQYDQTKRARDKTLGDYAKEERAHRREDWMLGPLAPNRNSGDKQGTFGTLDIPAFALPKLPRAAQGGPKIRGAHAVDWEGAARDKQFRGRTIVGNVVVGDRVCVVNGPDRLKGLIGYVAEVDFAQEFVRVTNVNVVDLKIPETAPSRQRLRDPNNPNSSYFNVMEAPIPMTDVRLVVPLTDNDGIKRDVVVAHVHAAEPYVQRSAGSNLPAHTRYITGSGAQGLSDDGNDLEIPWPEDRWDPASQWHEGDTEYKLTEEATWRPTMYGSPLGYDHDISSNVANLVDPKSPYTLGLILDKENVKNAERAGIHGFTDSNKLQARRNKIAEGIMNELRYKYGARKSFYEDIEWVQKKMLEDARAIWWQQRSMLTPTAEAAKRLAEQRKQAREQSTGAKSPEGLHGEIDEPEPMLDPDTEMVVREMQALHMKNTVDPLVKSAKI